MSPEELKKLGIVPWSEINEGLDRLHEHCLYQGYYSETDYKVTFVVYDDGVVELMIVDRKNTIQQPVHIKFKDDGHGSQRLIGKKYKPL